MGAVPVPIYRGPFGKAQAERLLWRAGFGARARRGGEAREARAQARGLLADAARARTSSSGPIRRTSATAPLAPADAVGDDHLSWLDRMVRTTAPLIERMTLIWHDWFATSNLGVASQRLMLNQVDMFRGNALGSFEDLLMNVTKDPAMLVWLNGNQNVKQKPNENYAREMMELFTLGADRGAYTETDVREQARALTGWQGSVVNRQSTGFAFNTARHDTGHEDDLRQDRQLTAGRTRASSASTTRLHPSFFVEKMWSYFIPTQLDSATSKALAGRATRDRPGASPSSSRSCCTRRSTRGRAWRSRRSCSTPACCGCAAATSTPSAWWTLGQQAGQQLFYPPDVGGWDDTRWLDTSTFRARWFIAALAQADASTPTDSPSDPAKLARPRARVLGHARRSRPRRRACSRRSRRRSSSARSTPATSRRRCAGSSPSSPDLQTA